MDKRAKSRMILTWQIFSGRKTLVIHFLRLRVSVVGDFFLFILFFLVIRIISDFVP